jgi:hypothetical protein
MQLSLPVLSHRLTQSSKVQCRKSTVMSSSSFRDDAIYDSQKRHTVIGLVVGATALVSSVSQVRAEVNAGESQDATIVAQDVPQVSSKASFKLLKNETLAYSFEYPVNTTSGAVIPMVLSRKPEKYSSAAPLTADARQRIVCELVSLMDAVTVSVSVGPPSGTLRTTKPEEWTAKQLAEQVLLDRSTGRVSSGQRVSLSTVEDAQFVTKNGIQYCLYEHVSQGSPTLISNSGTTYRHARAVTVARPGLDNELYLYTLNVSCPQERWEDLEEPFMRAIQSFTLDKEGPNYIAPNQDPWMFF